jgi:predicted CopG family antitoxin
MTINDDMYKEMLKLKNDYSKCFTCYHMDKAVEMLDKFIGET